MHPLHQAIFLTQVVLFFVATTAVAVIAVVAIAHHQCGHIVGQTSAEREVVGSPNLIDSLFQSVRSGMGAISMYVVIGVADVNSGTRKPGLGTPGSQRHICVVGGFFVGARIVPCVLGDPKVNVIAVVKLDVPRTAVSTFGPVKLVFVHRGVKGVSAATQMRSGPYARIQCHPVEHVIGAARATHGRFGVREIRGRKQP